jgi:uncharacterized membrane-anchored protein
LVADTALTRWRKLTIPLGIKVPEITAAFWIIKVLTTGMGEAASDYLVKVLGGPVAVPIGFIAFAAAMVWQLMLSKYRTWVYWLAVVMVSVFGTMAADVLHIGLHVPYALSTTLFVVVLAVVFALWRKSENTLSIHSINTTRRELFYWSAVLATFALGTAAGDLSARSLHLGYAGSTFLFAALMALPALAFWRLRSHGVFFFWCAYVVTRPLGASMADFLAVSHSRGGLGWGYGVVTLAWSTLIVAFVAYLAISHSDEQRSFQPTTER